MCELLKSAGLISMLCLTSFGAQATAISAGDIDTNWTEESDRVTGAEAATWSVVGGANTNGGKATGALVSNFTQSGDFSFSSTLTPTGNNGLMGLVFGWQDSDNTYILGWGGGGVSSSGGWDGIQLSKFSGGKLADLASTGSLWASGTSYLFEVGRRGTSIFASIKQGTSTIFNASLVDTMFSSGRVGFDTWSQSTSFRNTDISSSDGQVPVPATLLLLGLGLASLGWSRRKS